MTQNGSVHQVENEGLFIFWTPFFCSSVPPMNMYTYYGAAKLVPANIVPPLDPSSSVKKGK